MMTGRKLDLLLLTDHEAEHVLQVVQRDMRLRKKEEVRLSELKQELDEEGSRCLLLSRQSCFNQRCCIRCCSPFTFLLNPKRKCQDCNYNVCKACCVYCKPNKAWLCSACQRSRLLKTRSLEWFYTNVKKRFKRFGSAKVLKTLYRKHLVEHSVLSKLTEGSAYEESICNEGSICGSDSTFYRQTEEHSMAETHSVALRVAEEAVDEAITKAEIDTASQETQDEVSYLREHRRELIEELAKTIVQKIIHRKKTLAEMRADYDHERTMERYTDLHHPDGSISDDAAGSTTLQSNLWRSHSAFSLLDGASPVLQHTLKKEGSGSAMAAWRSVDRLDSAGVLKSPDGNWIALQSAQRSRTNLVTKRKSLVYSALERESMIVSAYEGLGSDDETKPEPDGSWGAVLLEIHKKMADERSAPSPTACLRGSKDNLSSDCDVGKKPNRPLMGLFKWKVPVEIRRPSSSRRTSVIDLNFNLEGAAGDQEKAESPGAPERVRRSRKKRRSRKEVADSSSSSSSSFPVLFSDAMTPDTLTCGATTPKVVDSDDNISEGRANHLDEELRFESQQQSGRDSDSFTRGGDLRKQGDDRCDRREGRSTNGDGEEEQSWSMEMDLDGGRRVDEEENEMDEEMRNRLYRLVSQSRQAYFSSTNDGLDRTCESEGGWDRDGDEDMEEEDGGRKEDGPEGFLSTEDQLDRVYVEGDSPRDDEDKKDVELAVKVCRLVHQVHATEFSSTEDELDRAGCDREEELIDAESLWKLQAEKAVQAAQLRDLASLVSASQFSSTEDELDRIGESEGGPEGKEEPSGSSDELEELREEAAERRESIGEIDVNMFDLREDIERSEVGGPERGTSEDISRSSFRGEEVAHEEREFQVNEGERAGGGQTESERIAAGDKKVAAGSCRTEKESREKTVEAERRNPTPAWQETQTPPEKEHGEHGEEAGRPVRECKRSPAHSDEEDAEFDRIISSMLLMTLEDMQAETMLGESGESGGGDGPQGGVASPEEDEGEEVKRRNSAGASEEKGRAVEESQGDRERTEWTGGKGSRESGGGRQDNEEHHVKEMQRDSKEASTKPVQLSMDGLLSPQEIQHVSHMEFFPTVQLISTLLEQRYAAMSLCSVTTEVLKLLNATEGLLHGEGGGHDTTRPPTTTASLPPDTDPKKLDQQFSTLEGNVYVAAGSVYRLEVELSDLEECARGIRSSTSDMELSFLEEQVAAAAAKVQQSDMQISDISARIAALKSAGLNVDPQTRFTKSRNTPPPPVTLDSSRQLRRRLPTPPVKVHKET